MKEKVVAIVLAAGQGKRMNNDIQKQYLLLHGKPILYYSLNAFESSFVDEVIIVVGKGEIEYCQEEIINKYGFQKVVSIVEGGKERYHSVYQGLLAINYCNYVMIHDGARPFVDQSILERAVQGVKKYNACVVGMPVKDTIKIVNENNFAVHTPKREQTWMIQTPQSFSYEIIKKAYTYLIERETELLAKGLSITDDAMVLEITGEVSVKIVEGSYKNIKITTPEDLKIAEIFL